MHIDRDAIARLLPHREPILLVDSARIDRPGESGRGRIALPGGVPLVDGHLASELTQELVLEAAAQTVGVVLGSAAGGPTADGQHLLLGFDDVWFDSPVPPSADGLEVQVDREEANASVCAARFRVESFGVGVASGRVMVMTGSAR